MSPLQLVVVAVLSLVVVALVLFRRPLTVGVIQAQTKGAPRLDVAGLKALMDAGANPFVVDLRKREQVQKDPVTVPGSIRLAPHLIVEHALSLEPGRTVVLWCT